MTLKLTEYLPRGTEKIIPHAPRFLWALQRSVTRGSGYRESAGYNMHTAEVTHRVTASWRELCRTFMPAEVSWISADGEVSCRQTNSAFPEGNMRKGESCIVSKQCATLSQYGGTFS